MMWLKEEEPEVFDKTYKFLQSNEFAVKMLTGEMLSDYSQASLTSALDVHRKEWFYELLDELGIPLDKLPELRPSTTIVGEVDSRVVDLTGLARGTPVILGGGDRPCASTGA